MGEKNKRSTLLWATLDVIGNVIKSRLATARLGASFATLRRAVIVIVVELLGVSPGLQVILVSFCEESISLLVTFMP